MNTSVLRQGREGVAEDNRKEASAGHRVPYRGYLAQLPDAMPSHSSGSSGALPSHSLLVALTDLALYRL